MTRTILTALLILTSAAGVARADDKPKKYDGYKLVWADEFNKDGKPDPKNWKFENGFVRNNELQWYQPDNASVKGGKLIIEGRREKKPNPNYKEGSSSWKTNRKFIHYTSSCLKTPGLHSWQYGRFEIRAKISTKAGLWPAIWFLGDKGQWPSNGEIDLMEFYRGNILANACWGTTRQWKAKWDSSKTPVKKLGDPKTWDQSFHLWRMDWDETAIKLYIDGKLLNTIELKKTINPTDKFGGPKNPFKQPHYILLNLAIGGNAGGDPSRTEFPTRYEIDYVRVYQKTDSKKKVEIEPAMISPGKTTYYVDGGNGKDEADGKSPGGAWKTLAHLNRVKFAPGDKILFKAGSTYVGQFKPKGSGTRESPIVVKSYGEGARPRIDCQAKALNAVHLYNVEYFHLTDLEITNKGDRRQPKRRGVLVQGENFGDLRGIVLRNLFIHDVNGSVVKKVGGGSAIMCRVGGKEKKTRFDGLLIEGCHLLRCERNGINMGGNWTRDKWHPSLNVVIRKNLLEEIPGDGIVPIACDGALVEHNVMRKCTRLLKKGDAAAGIWPWSCDNTVIQYNEVSDHKAPWDAQGFDSDYNSRNTVIQYNYSHDNEGGFLLICNAGKSKMPYNIGNIGTVVRYNISVNDGIRTKGQRDYFSPTFHISGPCKNTKIYNNLIIVPKKPSDKYDRTIVHMDNWGGPWPNNTLFANNMFVIEGACDWHWGKDKNTVFTNNLFTGTHEKGPKDTAAIKGKSPLFMNPYFGKGKAGFDWLKQYQLKAKSPLLGKGKPVAGMPDKDLWGAKVNKKTPNIGPDQSAVKE